MRREPLWCKLHSQLEAESVFLLFQTRPQRAGFRLSGKESTRPNGESLCGEDAAGIQALTKKAPEGSGRNLEEHTKQHLGGTFSLWAHITMREY